ncbi:MAG: HD domain-containing protein [Planctomycetales bacterium]|nr:HD domain-containing protein [Planctomycetales bacterium]
MLAIEPTTDGLIPISMATLSPRSLLGIDIYLRANAHSPSVLFCRANEYPDFERLLPLVSQGVNKLFIDSVDRGKYQQYLRENWADLLADESSPVANRAAIMSEVIRDVLNEEFSIGDTDSVVAVSQRLGNVTCDLLSDQSIIAQQLCNVLHHDYATFTHCTNVSMYCVLLGRELGYSKSDLKELAVGGLLHDLGKLQIDARILTKPGKLDDFEFREIMKHPGIGFALLVERDDLSFGQLMMTYQHHERIDGSGYPVGCLNDEIHPWAKLCAIVDVYEALTSHRPYRNPMSPKTALAVLDKGYGTEFDKEMLQCWRKLINSR